MFLESVPSAVFIGAHTDDEMICAGTLHKLVKMGVDVKVMIFACARIDGVPEEKSKEILAAEFNKSMDILGVPSANRWLLNWETRKLPDSRNEVRQYVYDFVKTHRPDLAFILSPNDDHQDHSAVGEESERVMKGRVRMILRCQYPWNYKNFNPNLFVTLTEDELKTKVGAINAYKSQTFRYNYCKLFEQQARADGLSIKEEIAEKFEIIRLVT